MAGGKLPGPVEPVAGQRNIPGQRLDAVDTRPLIGSLDQILTSYMRWARVRIPVVLLA